MNLKINIKRPQITKEEISANKNFSEVLRMYEDAKGVKRSFYRTSWFYTGLSTAAAIIIAVIFYIQPSNKHVFRQLTSLTPPIEKVKLSSSVYSVNADQGGTYNYKTGTVINIPAKAFIYKKSGKPVTGKIDLAYRELNDPIEFFLAGISMDYKKDGKKFAFETAGVIEVYATQKGEELALNMDKQLAISLASHESARDFNLYKFNTLSKTWEQDGNAVEPANETIAEKEKSQVNSITQVAALDEKLARTREQLLKSETAIRSLEVSKPFEPKQETKGWERFSVTVKNLKDFPELAIYDDVLFQATDNSADRSIYSVVWTDAKLSKKGNSYMLTLGNDEGITRNIAVKPVFEGEGYNTAQKIYKNKLAQYEELLVERRAIEGEKQQELKAMSEILNDSRNAELSHQQENKELAENTTNPGNLTFHNISINSCGIWGLNKLSEYPMGVNITPHFTDEQGKEIRFADGKIYLVEKGRNVLFSFDQSNTIAYNPQKETMIWGVVNNETLAVRRLTDEDFKASGTINGSYNFVMQVSNVDLADESAVEYFLNI